MRVAESGCAAIIAAAGIWFLLLARCSRLTSRSSRRRRRRRPTRRSRRRGIRCTARPLTTGRDTLRTSFPTWGRFTFRSAPRTPEAQKFVDQGVAQLHSFLYFESERSFRQAAKLDPGCAMAYWGMAMSNVNNPRRAKGFLKEARQAGGRAQPAGIALLDRV